MRRFYLARKEDVSGVSGTGRIAEGCTFDNGFVALTWLTGHFTLSYYNGIEELIEIHGHEGRTVVEWLDTPEGEAISKGNALDTFNRWRKNTQEKLTQLANGELSVDDLKRKFLGDD
jgi:hypothetical protein